MRVRQHSRENPALYRRRSLVLVCPAIDMPSFVPCLHEEAETRIFARATKAAKRHNKKISCCAVETGVVVLVIPVAKIRNRYNQAPRLTQDSNGKVTTSKLDITNESQEISPFPAGQIVLLFSFTHRVR